MDGDGEDQQRQQQQSGQQVLLQATAAQERTVRATTDVVTNRAKEIKDALLTDIARGLYRREQRLPSERELARIFHASRDTIRWALEELERQGVVTKRGTSGTYVTAERSSDTGDLSPADLRLAETLAEESVRNFLEFERSLDERRDSRALLDFLTPYPGDVEKVVSSEPLALVSARAVVALGLGLPFHALVLRRYRVMERKRGPTRQRYIMESYYPGEQFIDLLRKGLDESRLNKWVQVYLQPSVGHVMENADMRAPTVQEQHQLQIPHRRSLTQVSRRKLHREGHVLELTYLYVPIGTAPWRREYVVDKDGTMYLHED